MNAEIKDFPFINTNNYPLRIYAVYQGEDYSVKIFEYPARKRDEYCIQSAVYLNKCDAYITGFIRLPSNEFYKSDFGKTINLINSKVTYFLDRDEAIKCARGKILKQFRAVRKEIEDTKEEIIAAKEKLINLEEKLIELESIESSYISREYSSDITFSTSRKDSCKFR